MLCLQGRTTLLSALIAGLLAMGGMTSCGRMGDVAQEAQVKHAFESCKAGLINNQTDQVMACVPRNVDDYLNRLKSGGKNPSPVTVSRMRADDSPGVDLFLRTALERKVPDDLRPGLTFALLMQHIAEKKLLNPHDVQQIDLGHIFVNGDRASAEIYYQGSFTALRLPFVQEGKDWKIDILAILPYAEVLMQVDRTIKGETVGQQVELLVSGLPSL